MSHPKEKSGSEHQHSSEPYEGVQVSESKFWRKLKQDPVVPIGSSGVALASSSTISLPFRNDRLWLDRPRSNHRFQSTRSKQTHIDLLVMNPLTNVKSRSFSAGFVPVSMLKDSLFHCWPLLLCTTQSKIERILTSTNMERSHHRIMPHGMIRNNLLVDDD